MSMEMRCQECGVTVGMEKIIGSPGMLVEPHICHPNRWWGPEGQDLFDPTMAERMANFKWCGYDQKEMRSMRNFALKHGWLFVAECELCHLPVESSLHIRGCRYYREEDGTVGTKTAIDKELDFLASRIKRAGDWIASLEEIKSLLKLAIMS
jgi:hypothetical protein